METFGLLISLLIFTLSLFIILKLFTPRAQKLPPGPPKLPLIGNLHQLTSKTAPHQKLQELARVYGPIMHLTLGEVPTVVISSAEVAKEMMTTHDANFSNRPKLMVGKEFFYDYTDMGMAPYGEYWRQVRKIATLELFTAKRVKSFRSIREEEVTHFVKSIASEAASETVVNLSEKLFGLSFDITCSHLFFLFNSELHSTKRVKIKKPFTQLPSLWQRLSGFAIADLYPSIKLLHSVGGMKRSIKDMVEKSSKILDPIINEHKSSNNRHNKQEEDFVDILLKFHKDDSNGSEFSLTTNNIKAIILEVFAGGSETSSTLLEWVMSELLKNPKIMERAQNEVRQVYQRIGTVDETRLNDLKFLKQVIKETLRLHPPTPLLAPRESIERCVIHGYEIPPKTRVLVNAWAIGRDSKYWSNPVIFNPERFDTISIDYKGTNFELIPFGAGRRMCPGVTLGMANVELPLAMLLYHFDWKLPSGLKHEDLDMDELFGITMRRKNELHVIPIPYVSSSLLK